MAAAGVRRTWSWPTELLLVLTVVHLPLATLAQGLCVASLLVSCLASPLFLVCVCALVLLHLPPLGPVAPGPQ
jgi:hypothetical protein